MGNKRRVLKALAKPEKQGLTEMAKQTLIRHGYENGFKAGIPKRYRGFDISISLEDNPPNGLFWLEHYKGGKHKYLYAYDGKYYNGAYFDINTSDIECWNKFRPALDKAIDRHEKRVRPNWHILPGHENKTIRVEING